MTKTLFYAYCRSIYSSMRIATAIFEEVAFVVLAGGNQPDFRTVNEFRRWHIKSLPGVFVQIEDPAESNLLHTAIHGPLKLRQRLPRAIFHFEPRHSNIESAGEVTIDRIYRSTLKMKPTRIMVPEIIDWKTAYIALSAMNVGQPGSPSTIHATGCQNALQKAEDYLLAYPGGAYNNPEARANLIAGINLIIYSQQEDGHRFIREIAEVRQSRRGEFPVAVPVYLDEGSGLRRIT